MLHRCEAARKIPGGTREHEQEQEEGLGVKPPTHSEGPFLVFPGGNCVPIDGPLRVALLWDGWYVIGENSTVPCGSERAARATLRQLMDERDPNSLAQDAVESVDPADAGLDRG